MTAKTEPDPKCQVAYCDCGCGALVYAHVLPSHNPKELARDLAQLARKGCEITTMPASEFRASGCGFGCKSRD